MESSQPSRTDTVDSWRGLRIIFGKTMKPAEIQNCDFVRLYRINFIDFCCDFVPGHTAQGEQILLGVLEKELLVALFFATTGQYNRYVLRPVLWNPDLRLLPGQQLGQHADVLQEHMKQWANELGMTPRDIYIRHFAFPDWEIGIAEWPLADWENVQHALATGTPLEDEFLI
jgi:hypothetical protein